LQESHEEEVNPNARGIGYYWKCYTCGYTSEWHMFANTAVSRAHYHAERYGHRTTVFPK
ncbi:hypothetical protein OIA_05179, partial [Enterococcus faecium EnGen0018]